jgi:hypothetical protein
LFFGEAAEGGERTDSEASYSISFSEEATDFWDPATSLSGREVPRESSVTTARPSTSPPSGRGGREDKT